MAPTIFLSYRRDDSAGFARALYDYLRQYVPAENLFLDVDTVAPGAVFARLAEDRIAQSDVFLLLIGKTWLTIANAHGRRLDQPDDLVRVEVETALKSGVRVVPVLIDGATMPPADALPPSLHPITQFNAVTLTHAHFHEQADRLLPLLAPPPSPARGATLAVLALLGAAAALGLAWQPLGLLGTGLGVAAGLGAGVALAAALGAWRPRVRFQAWPRLAGAALTLGLLAVLGVRAFGQATAPFDVTVQFEAPRASDALRGEVELRYGQTTRRAPVADAAPVVFADVPGRYRSALVVTPHVDGFQSIADSFAGATHTLRLEPAVFATPVRGTVVDAAGGPLAGVVLDFDSGLVTTTTDSLGRFAVTVPRQAGTPLMLHATRDGHAGYHDLVTVSATVPLRIPFETP